MEEFIAKKSAAKAKPAKKKTTSKKPRTVKTKALRQDDNAGFNSRQSKLLNFIKEGKQVSMKEINSKFDDVTQRTLRRDLDKLENEGFITQQGATRNSVYIYR